MPENTFTRVSDLFEAAGSVFTRLGNLTVSLQASISSDQSERAAGGSQAGPAALNHFRWSKKEVDMLRDAILRFSSDLTLLTDTIEQKSRAHMLNKLRATHMPQELPGNQEHKLTVTIKRNSAEEHGYSVQGGPDQIDEPAKKRIRSSDSFQQSMLSKGGELEEEDEDENGEEYREELDEDEDYEDEDVENDDLEEEDDEEGEGGIGEEYYSDE